MLLRVFTHFEGLVKCPPINESIHGLLLVLLGKGIKDASTRRSRQRFEKLVGDISRHDKFGHRGGLRQTLLLLFRNICPSQVCDGPID